MGQREAIAAGGRAIELVALDPGESTATLPARCRRPAPARGRCARAWRVDPPVMLDGRAVGAIDPITRTRLRTSPALQQQIRKTVC